MKHLLLAALLALAAPIAAASRPVPASDAQVDRLLEVMRVRQTLEAMLPQVQASQEQMVAQVVAGQSLSEAQRDSVQRITARSGVRIREMLAWDRMAPLYRDIYRETFSGDDIDAMIGFYSSPAGQKLLDKMPQLMQNTMAAVQKLIVPMVQQTQRDIAAELRTSQGVESK